MHIQEKNFITLFINNYYYTALLPFLYLMINSKQKLQAIRMDKNKMSKS